jgi:hypothetical protein
MENLDYQMTEVVHISSLVQTSENIYTYPENTQLCVCDRNFCSCDCNCPCVCLCDCKRT